ncbi:hypothetical protein [Microbacterium aurantiacum]|uniref:Uncharacterized protein n=1 Tax=Microbacterium aurantiacum TaxID=162393 RepID=A0AAJ2HKK4_9MICO|nr:hypothetical protein [Microbacterium aurantiacum]MDS0246494.1 hypothetical protein [Microbacterium aurantiacum]
MADAERQRVERLPGSRPGSRRARLTPAPDTTAEPVPGDETTDATSLGEAASVGESGPNDERLRRDVPPHY